MITTFNRRELLARTLPRVLAQDYHPERFEVVVVDDGSTDGTGAFLQTLKPRCGFRVLRQTNRGPAAARNRAVTAASGTVVLFLDDDILVERTLVRIHAEAHADGVVDIVNGGIHTASESVRTLAADLHREWWAQYSERLVLRQAPGLLSPGEFHMACNMSIRHSTFAASGGFDEERLLSPHGGFELALRLSKMGAQFRYEPEALVHELYVKSTIAFLRRDPKAIGRAEILLCNKHPDYRPHSALVTLAGGNLAKRLLREYAIRLPFPAELLLVPIPWAADRIERPMLRRAGHAVVQRQYRVGLLREARRQAGSWRAFRTQFGLRLPVLLYHHVGPLHAGTESGLTISPVQFERQLRWLAKRDYVGISPSQWLAWRFEGCPLPNKPVLLTFDDAYRDLVSYAFPPLRRCGFSAGVFVVTALTADGDGREPAREWAGHPVMTRTEIQEWATRGIEFGAHSRTHSDLTTISEHALVGEVAGSRDDLAAFLDTPVRSFAYPFGFYNNAVETSVARTFDMAFTCEEGLNEIRTDPFLLRRSMVLPSDSLFDFANRVRFGSNPIQQVRERMRLRTRLRAMRSGLRD